MHIESFGDGPDLVLLHGWAMHGGVFAPLAEPLARHFRLHVVDLPGHGWSRDDTTPLEPAACARAIIAATPPGAWLGWSFGGLIAQRAALDHPDHVRALALIAASPRFVAGPGWACGIARDVLAGFAAGLRTDWRHTVDGFLALEVLGSEHAKAELRELRARVFGRGAPALPALLEGLAILDAVDLRGELPRLAVPSLWIAGRRDRLIPPAAMRWSAGVAPGGRYLELDGGHAPFIAHAGDITAALHGIAA